MLRLDCPVEVVMSSSSIDAMKRRWLSRSSAHDGPNAALRLSGVCEHGKSYNYFMALAVATE